MTTDKIQPSSAVNGHPQLNSLPEEVRNLIASAFSASAGEVNRGDDMSANSFCDCHAPDSPEFEKSHSTWTITVQLLRLMLSILNLASDLARQRKVQESSWAESEIGASDLELMFHDGGRGGFQWLECLVKDDGGWIEDVVRNSTGITCPACLLGRVFESECSIRLLVIAARLAGDDLNSYVTYIKEYLLQDPWWGPGYWETIEPKAILLEGQVRELLSQCFAIRRSLEDGKHRRRGINNNNNNMRRNATVINNGSRPVEKAQLFELSVRLAQALESSLEGRGAMKLKTREEWENYKVSVYTWFGLLFGELSLLDPSLSEAIAQKYLSTSRLTRSLTV